jgi:hypothetical protein
MRNTLLLIMLYCSIPAWAQINLVPNPSFEDTLNCDSFKTYHAGFPWFTPTNCTPDYYYGASPTCGTSAFQNPAGYQLPYDGIAYIGLYATDGTTTREYICIELNDTLLFNKDYFLEFYVSRANQFSLATDDIGAHLSTLLPINTGCYYLPYLPQVENPQGNIITDSLSWTRISGVFTAQGGEKYLTIGNFKDSSNTTVVDADNGNGVNNSSYYYIDKVSLIPLDSLQGIAQPYNISQLIDVFPTLATIGSFITIILKLERDVDAQVYSIDGKMKRSFKLANGTNSINTSGMSPGLYFIAFKIEDAIAYKKVLIF